MLKIFCGALAALTIPGCAALSLFGQTHNHTHHHYHNVSDTELRERLSKLEAKDGPIGHDTLRNAQFLSPER